MPIALVNRNAVIRLAEIKALISECPSKGSAFRAILMNEQADGLDIAVREPGFWHAFIMGRVTSEEVNGGGPNRGMLLRWPDP